MNKRMTIFFLDAGKAPHVFEGRQLTINTTPFALQVKVGDHEHVYVLQHLSHWCVRVIEDAPDITLDVN